eukprot:8787547-Ditylum_brightwellii.AAC.1
MKEHWVIKAHQQSNQYHDGRNGVSFVQGGGRGNSMGHGGQGGRVTDGNPETYANGRPQTCPLDGKPVAGINGNVIRDMLCFCCDRYGHGHQSCSEWIENVGTRQ